MHHSFTEKDIMNFAAISSTPLALNKTYEQKQLRQVMNVLTSVERDDLDENVQLHRSFSLLRTIVYVAPTVTEKTTAKLKQLAARGTSSSFFTEMTGIRQIVYSDNWTFICLRCQSLRRTNVGGELHNE
ncbi:hypothetical protein [Geomicrobium sp. JCM 19055]|uniref:hypothetical protein n=1 Tax=Geomicrobium sp. JCM 19055 TaxID=1460649 RepID=UPI0005A84F66|nr:hypothetical protein [Geomicrobium sp. JCM 19055]